ncbi:tetratricopeptide repeat protein [Pedobacter sp. B4-66]|uniref:type IX secretion system periplasmic lipoprotein PorW/SprE n=1 Tax=Pedobacter sp. B4-66 TaxID=2817280 RepID=UPI001BDAF414|nr:tetratricopeptide repeat protein [Pedobacter sp. B4-66]
MKNYAIYNLKVILFSLCVCIVYSCSTHKDTASSRGVQNLTARYNYIYNSKVLLITHQQELAETYVDNYDQILPVFLGPVTDNNEVNTSLNLKPMDDIIKKAQTIILEKSYSNYTDDAYILLGKANFFNGNYFNAAEYFDYTARTYKKNINSYLEALNWKARSLMQLKRISEANKVLDTLESILPDIKKKRNLAEPFATLAQMCIYLDNNAAAISYLKDAIKAGTGTDNRIRWTYILAQLYEKQKNSSDALINYRKVVKSNAPFEMYFNANLNQIKLKTLEGGPQKANKQDQLLGLLKDDKNLDYNDQVYFQIAESHAADEEFKEALKYYELSIQKSTTNQYQKGLSYLRIADLNFRVFKDYLKAKSYYDSTVNTLPKTYPGYDLILRKNLNLQYLTNRYQIISIEDSLQSIAKLPEASRAEKIKLLANPVVATVQPSNTSSTAGYQPTYGRNNNAQLQSSFYFSNPTAITIGFSDFKRKWGNRKLENNWRQSIRTSAQETSQEIANNINTPISPDEAVPVVKDAQTLLKQYTDSLPVTPELLAKSNQKIIDAYYEIASFYLQELNSPKEAAEAYQLLLNRFPANNHLAATYYSLFLINKGIDEPKSSDFKNKVLKDFPSTIYAKIIIDPSFSLKQSELETAINTQYNEIFEQYLKKDFNTVIGRVNETSKSSSGSFLAPQFAYLKAIAIGRTSKVDALLTAFGSITEQFPDDKLITPLVKGNLIYINEHLADFQKRDTALIDFDPNEPPYFGPRILTSTVSKINEPVAPEKPDQTAKIQEIAKPVPSQPTTPDAPKAPAVKVDGPFSTAVSTVYYYVIDVADGSLTLSSSRFGIGQFNRGNYAGSNLKHQLKEFDNDQLIYVGNFSNFDDAKTYATGITPQLKQIMKVPVNIYTGFIISKENFDKLTSKTLLDKYIEFYKNNY